MKLTAATIAGANKADATSLVQEDKELDLLMAQAAKQVYEKKVSEGDTFDLSYKRKCVSLKVKLARTHSAGFILGFALGVGVYAQCHAFDVPNPAFVSYFKVVYQKVAGDDIQSVVLAWPEKKAIVVAYRGTQSFKNVRADAKVS